MVWEDFFQGSKFEIRPSLCLCIVPVVITSLYLVYKNHYKENSLTAFSPGLQGWGNRNCWHLQGSEFKKKWNLKSDIWPGQSLLDENTISWSKYKKKVRKPENIWVKSFEETPSEMFTDMNSSKEERWMLKDSIWEDSQGCQGNIRVHNFMGSLTKPFIRQVL